MKKEPLQVGEMVADTFGLFDIQAQESKISLHADIQPDLPSIMADRELA
jgi:hypothetical protein